MTNDFFCLTGQRTRVDKLLAVLPNSKPGHLYPLEDNVQPYHCSNTAQTSCHAQFVSCLHIMMVMQKVVIDYVLSMVLKIYDLDL